MCSCLYSGTQASDASNFQRCSQQELFMLYYTSKMKSSLFLRSLSVILKFHNAEKHRRAFCKYRHWVINGSICSIVSLLITHFLLP